MPGNLVQVAEQLKGAPDQFLQQESQAPSGYAPPFLILGEISRRQQLRKSSQAQPPTTTVAQDLAQAAAPPPPQPGMTMPPGMAPPQGPPSVGLGALMRQQPIRMAVGGPVGMYPSLPTANWLENSVFSLGQKTQEQVDEENRKKKMYATPEGYVIGGVLFPKLPDAPAFEARPPEPIHIEEPAIEPLLERVRAMREGPTSTYENRVAELEQERKKIKSPGLGDWLLQTGLGSMASRSPFAFQAFGEAASGALKDVTNRREYADEQRRGIAGQIANVRLAQEQEQRRKENQNFDLASAMQQRLHGQAVTEAQAKMQYSGQVEAARRAAYEQMLEQQRAQHKYGTQLATTSLEQLSKVDPFDPRYREQKEWEARMRHGFDIDLERERSKNDMAQIYARLGAGKTEAQKLEAKLQSATNLNNAVGAMIDTEVRKGYHDYKNQDASDILDISRKNIADNLMKPEYFQDIPPARRKLLRDRVLAWNPTQDYRDQLDAKVSKWSTNPKTEAERMKGALAVPNLNEAAGGEEGTLPNYLPARPEGGAAAPAAGPTTGANGKIIMDESYVTGYKPGQEDKKPAPARQSVGLAASPHLQRAAPPVQTPAPVVPPTPPPPPTPRSTHIKDGWWGYYDNMGKFVPTYKSSVNITPQAIGGAVTGAGRAVGQAIGVGGGVPQAASNPNALAPPVRGPNESYSDFMQRFQDYQRQLIAMR